jgi:hypothetical protein
MSWLEKRDARRHVSKLGSLRDFRVVQVAYIDVASSPPRIMKTISPVLNNIYFLSKISFKIKLVRIVKFSALSKISAALLFNIYAKIIELNRKNRVLYSIP